METYSDRLPEWVPVPSTSSWRVACWLAGVCVLLDVLALVIANDMDLHKCEDGWSNLGQNLVAIAFLVVPVTLAAVVAGAYAARRHRKRRRHAMLLIASVVASGALTLVLSSAWMSTAPTFRATTDFAEPLTRSELPGSALERSALMRRVVS